ncbi:unnamed protein product [Rotaria sp. Silwood2]|nr:unnamed protein product [Rotaria sp. Silwood2]CAF2676988.1 unnamed protein product [Rotaria sp. Silwood2]CAF2955853.1 unnamed protein product [Rotaria sp. Silwood2]CAF3102015.1 unnamed protein product [Rotaria sp. Silwood2]CAF3903556.1 unnamed protein product [Rotaria sp. Silwood2]
MGNIASNNNTSTFLSRWPTSGQDLASKQIQISTDKPDGIYFTGEYLTGTVEIPISYIQQHIHSKNNRKLIEFLRQKSLGDDIIIELVGDAIYSAEVDSAADSDGHATHKVNVCRQRCFLTINQDIEKLFVQNGNQIEPSFDQTINTKFSTSDTQDASSTVPAIIKGTFKLQIPHGLPPSLNNNCSPSVIYTLELNLSSSSYRYQIPIIINSKGCLPYSTTHIELNSGTINQHDICLQASLSKRFYRPSEQVLVRINYLNPKQRSIRSITVTLMQFYRIHHDEYRSELDGKEWTFDTSTMSPQQEWFGEARLQLPCSPLQASFSNQTVGTTQQIECELDYRIFIELYEKKGDNIHFTLPSINVTYQT